MYRSNYSSFAGYRLVTSVLKWDFEPLTYIDDVISKLGSRIVSITMFNSSNDVVAYKTRKLFHVTFSLLPVRSDNQIVLINL